MIATIQELLKANDRANAYIEARVKNEVKPECYTCTKWTFYGKSCNGTCKPTARNDG